MSCSVLHELLHELHLLLHELLHELLLHELLHVLAGSLLWLVHSPLFPMLHALLLLLRLEHSHQRNKVCDPLPSRLTPGPREVLATPTHWQRVITPLLASC